MKFKLNAVLATLTNVNSRPELHGEDKKLAADLKFEAHVHQNELEQFDRRLKPFLYEKASQGDLDADFLPQLRFPLLAMPLKWAGEQVGGKLTVHQGISAKSDLVVDGCLFNEFKIEAIEGGSVALTFRVQIHPDEKTIGKLCMLSGQEVKVSIEPPAEGEAGADSDQEEEQEPA